MSKNPTMINPMVPLAPDVIRSSDGMATGRSGLLDQFSLEEPSGDLRTDLDAGKKVLLQRGITIQHVQSEPDMGPGVVQFIACTEGIKRDGNIVRNDGWHFENFARNPQFLWCHDYESLPIGRHVEWKVDKIDGESVLRLWSRFCDEGLYPFADTVRKMYERGYLNAGSVGWIPIRYEPIYDDNDEYVVGMDFKENDLLEFSGCPVPSDPKALIEAVQRGVICADDMEKMVVARNSNGMGEKCYVLSNQDIIVPISLKDEERTMDNQEEDQVEECLVDDGEIENGQVEEGLIEVAVSEVESVCAEVAQSDERQIESMDDVSVEESIEDLINDIDDPDEGEAVVVKADEPLVELETRSEEDELEVRSEDEAGAEVSSHAEFSFELLDSLVAEKVSLAIERQARGGLGGEEVDQERLCRCRDMLGSVLSELEDLIDSDDERAAPKAETAEVVAETASVEVEEATEVEDSPQENNLEASIDWERALQVAGKIRSTLAEGSVAEEVVAEEVVAQEPVPVPVEDRLAILQGNWKLKSEEDGDYISKLVGAIATLRNKD